MNLQVLIELLVEHQHQEKKVGLQKLYKMEIGLLHLNKRKVQQKHWKHWLMN